MSRHVSRAGSEMLGDEPSDEAWQPLLRTRREREGEDTGEKRVKFVPKGQQGFIEGVFTPAFLICFLSLVNLMNYVDRGAMGGVLERVIDDFDLKHFEGGALGACFVAGFMVFSPAFAQAAHYWPATRLMALGLLVWCAAAVLGYLSNDFWTLVLARTLTGVGEASFAGLAPTTIDDVAPPASKARWLALFYTAIPLGAALGYIGSGQIVKHLGGWQLVFLVEGIVMFPLAIITFYLPASKGRRVLHGDVEEYEVEDWDPEATLFDPGRAVIAVWDGMHTLFTAPIWLLIVGGYAAQTAVIGGFSLFLPGYIERRFSVAGDVANLAFGGVTVCTGILGTILGGVVLDKRLPRSPTPGVHVSVAMQIATWLTAPAIPLVLVAFRSASLKVFLMMLFVTQLLLFASITPVNSSLLATVSLPMRSLSMAMCIFGIHLFGDFPSPFLIGYLSDRWGSTFALSIISCSLFVSLFAWGTAFLLARSKLDSEGRRHLLLAEILSKDTF